MIIINLMNVLVSAVNVMDVRLEKRVVLIDAGHGGEDGGAVGLYDTVEKDINLEISLKIRDILKDNGYVVIMTRESDKDLADPTLKSVSQRKKSDMNARVDLINASEADLVISIHQNCFSDGRYGGAQMFYSSNVEESAVLAEILQDEVIENLQNDSSRLAKCVDDKFLLNNSDLPTVIIECGFLSNENDVSLLCDTNYQTEFALTVLDAITKFYQK